MWLRKCTLLSGDFQLRLGLSVSVLEPGCSVDKHPSATSAVFQTDLWFGTSYHGVSVSKHVMALYTAWKKRIPLVHAFPRLRQIRAMLRCLAPYWPCHLSGSSCGMFHPCAANSCCNTIKARVKLGVAKNAQLWLGLGAWEHVARCGKYPMLQVAPSSNILVQMSRALWSAKSDSMYASSFGLYVFLKH